jgi:hypothetical protein
MNRLKPTILIACALSMACLTTYRLAAQPEQYRPIVPGDAPYELTLPPGTYQSLIIAFEGGAGSKVVKATLKAPSGEMVLLVGGGETLVVPLSSTGWTVTQQASISLTQPVSQVHVTAITPAGPVKLEPAKK